MWLIVSVLAVPLIEIALFITIGARIGLWPTLGIVIATGVAGVAVIRWQGLQAMAGLRQAGLRRGGSPLGQMADGGLLGLAGVLLILPGFLTDTLGLILLLPPVRRLVIRRVAARAQVHTTAGFDGPRRSGADVIDGEFFEIAQDQPEFPTGFSRNDRRFPEDRRH